MKPIKPTLQFSLIIATLFLSLGAPPATCSALCTPGVSWTKSKVLIDNENFEADDGLISPRTQAYLEDCERKHGAFQNAALARCIKRALNGRQNYFRYRADMLITVENFIQCIDPDDIPPVPDRKKRSEEEPRTDADPTSQEEESLGRRTKKKKGTGKRSGGTGIGSGGFTSGGLEIGPLKPIGPDSSLRH